MHDHLRHIYTRHERAGDIDIVAFVLHEALTRIHGHNYMFEYPGVDFSPKQLLPLQTFLQQIGLHVHLKTDEVLSALVVPNRLQNSFGSVHIYSNKGHLRTILADHPKYGPQLVTWMNGIAYSSHGPLDEITGLDPIAVYGQLARQLKPHNIHNRAR